MESIKFIQGTFTPSEADELLSQIYKDDINFNMIKTGFLKKGMDMMTKFARLGWYHFKQI